MSMPDALGLASAQRRLGRTVRLARAGFALFALAFALQGCGGASHLANHSSRVPSASSPTVSEAALKTCLDRTGAASVFIDRDGGASQAAAGRARAVLAAFGLYSPWSHDRGHALQTASSEAPNGVYIYVFQTPAEAKSEVALLGSTAQTLANVAWVGAGALSQLAHVPPDAGKVIQTCVMSGALPGGEPPAAPGSATEASGSEYATLRAAAGDLMAVRSNERAEAKADAKTHARALQVLPLVRQYLQSPSPTLLQQIAAIAPELISYDNITGKATGLKSTAGQP
jgi:hypothetical protein